MKRITLFVLLLCALPLLAQVEGQSVNVQDSPPSVAFQRLFVYSGSDISYICWARSTQPLSGSIAISAASNASPVSLTSAAHGFDANSKPIVTISGGTGNWAALNGEYTATVTGVDTFTVPVDSSAFGVVAGTLVFKTKAPRKGQAVWSVQKLTYDGSGNTTGIFWVGGNTAFNKTCAAPTQYQ